MDMKLTMQPNISGYQKTPEVVAESGKDREKLTIRPSNDIYETAEPSKAPGIELPKNFLFASNGISIALSDKLRNTFREYYRGTADEKTVTNMMSSAVSDLVGYYSQLGFDAKEIAPKVIEDVYDESRLCSISGACVASWYESKSLAAQFNGHEGNTGDWIYYNADYYYSSEAMKETLISAAHNMADKYGVTVTNLPTSYPDGDLRKEIYSSYNTVINFDARSSSLCGNMIDETMEPPKGFRFFYKSNDAGTNLYPAELSEIYESPFDGVLQIWQDDWSFQGRVPISLDPTRFILKANMFDVVSNSGKPYPEKISGFLKNFDFHAVMNSGIYHEQNPRRLG